VKLEAAAGAERSRSKACAWLLKKKFSEFCGNSREVPTRSPPETCRDLTPLPLRTPDPISVVGFLFEFSKFCVQTPSAVRVSDHPRDSCPLPLLWAAWHEWRCRHGGWIDVSSFCHALSRLTLLGCKLCGLDLPVAEMARPMRLADTGDDVIVDGCKPKQHVDATEERSNLSFEPTAFGQVERQIVSDRDSLLTSFLRESIF
jgi:hypothetical protein